MSYSIAIGPGNHPEGDYQLSFGTGGKVYSTTMTPEEYEIVNRVVLRSLVLPTNIVLGYQSGTGTIKV